VTARIEELDSNGSQLSLWTDDAPRVDTSDGLWWVEHADTENPDPADFVEPPYIYGTGGECDTLADNLDFDVEGNAYTPPPEGPPYTITTSIDYTFKLEGSSSPLRDGKDEVADMPGSQQDDPYCP